MFMFGSIELIGKVRNSSFRIASELAPQVIPLNEVDSSNSYNNDAIYRRYFDREMIQ